MPSAPGLHIQGIGPVPLPLTDQIASLLQLVATEAPHGQGPQTALDTTVRKPLQIDPTLVSLQNPAWEPALVKLFQQEVATALGIDPFAVRVDLYKLLLYPTGSFCTPLRDMEKIDGMLATLVIQLPSQFTGGTVNVSHGQQRFTFSLGAGEDAAFACHYLAHFVDCEHEVLPVTSGYRLALVYSLCHLWQTTPHATDRDGRPLSSCLERLPTKSSMFILPLSHRYRSWSFSEVGAGALIGCDRTKQQALEHAAGQQWKIIIAEITRTDDEMLVAAYNDGEVEAVTRGDIKLTFARYSADGSSAHKVLDWLRKISNFDLVDDGGMILASKEEFDKKWGGGESDSAGKEGETRLTTYRTFVLIVFNESTLFERLCAQDLSAALREAERNPNYVDRLFAYLKGSNLPLTAFDCFKLLSLIPFDSLPVDVAAARLELVVRCLRDDCLPSQRLGVFLVGLVDKYGWSSPILAPIRTLLQQFLQKMGFLQHLPGNNDSNTTRITPTAADVIHRTSKKRGSTSP